MTSPRGPLTGRPPARSQRGMVSTTEALASGAGLAALRKGGSAADAAIAANAVLCVTYPHMAGLGGDAFALVHDGDQVSALSATGPAGSEATREHYANRGHPADIPDRGPLSALTVPGAVEGWHKLHQRHGRLPWKELFDDAIYAASEGFAVGRSLSAWLPQDAALLAKDKEAARTYLPGGRVPRAGEVLTNPALAESFRVLASRGARDGFYEHQIAELLCAADSPLEPQDFADYQAGWADPIHGSYRGLQVWQMPPSTQGFTALQILAMLEEYEVAGWGDLSPDYIHHLAEAAKLSFADRDAWLTDPEHHHIPLPQLLDKDYARQRAEQISADQAMTMGEVDSGIPGGWTGPRPGPAGDTCYLAAADEDGLMVSLIQSIYHDFGSGVMPEGTGIVLQNRGSFFSLDEKHHNRLDPGKRTFHTLMPALARHSDGSAYAAFGTMGGEGQPQTQAAMLTRLVDFGYDMQQAVEAPRWLMGRTWGAESQDLSVEGRIPDLVAAELTRRGQPVKLLTDFADDVGHAQGIRIHPEGYYEGGADPRGDGLALGY